MSDQLMGLLNSEADVARRGGLLPFLRRVIPDIGGDDISEFEGPLELATPALAYDPVRNMALTGAMLRGHIPVDEGLLTQTMLDAPLMGGLLAGAAGAVPRGAVLGANVFHGGPHRFAPEPDFPHGRPRLDKIGTGEGSQVYGYGFYSADAPGVATQYQKGVKNMGEVQRLNDEMSELVKVMDQDSGPGYRNFMSDKGQEAAQKYDELLTAREAVVSAPGTLYKLDIPDADVAKYLDWDKPLSEQSEILNKIISVTGKTADELKALDADYEALSGRLINLKPGTKERQALQLEWDAAFSDPHRRIGSVLAQMDKPIGTFGYDAASKQTGGELLRSLGPTQETSEFFRKAGIPGLKYFDQGSRAGGEGTRNYVTWDQDVLNRSKMLERDGVTLGANKGPTAALPGLLDDVGIETTQRGNVLEITKIETPDNLRGQGLADQRLEQLIQQADADGTTLALTPSNAFGANKSRLTKWYKRHGFVPNKGRNKDFTTRESMVRPPRNIELGANKSPTAALPGLLDDTASRMQRARDMGFDDEVLFHGTSDDVRYFDLDHPNRKDSGWLGTGVYLTDDPNLASFYSSATAGPVGPNVLPMKVKLKNPYNATLKDKERLKMISFTKGKEAARAAADEWTAELQKKGHDGVVLQYDPKDVGAANASKEVVVFDTRNVRSTSAKFDPAKAESADLLAANPVTAALPGLLEQQYMEDSERLLQDSQGLLGATQRRNNQLNALQQFFASGGV